MRRVQTMNALLLCNISTLSLPVFQRAANPQLLRLYLRSSGWRCGTRMKSLKIYSTKKVSEMCAGELFSAELLMKFLKNEHANPRVQSLFRGGAIPPPPWPQGRQLNGYQSYGAT